MGASPNAQIRVPPLLRDEIEGQVVSLRKVMDDEVFDSVFAEGATMSLEEAAAYALEEIAYS
jgi:hypothetical protein